MASINSDGDSCTHGGVELPSHHFTLPSGVSSLTSPLGFDPDFGLEFEGEAIPLDPDEILGESNLWLDRYGYTPITTSDINKPTNIISAEVGDDELTASDNKAFIGLQPVFHRLMGMRVSLQDTSINSRFGNFAEDIICLPDGYGQTYLNARKTGRFTSMSYMDVPKLRLAIDIRPMRMDHSATNDGKASMIGARQRWIPLNSPFRGIYEIFNLFQDINLGLHRDRKYPYLPESLGGYGKEPPFRNPENFLRFMSQFKSGSHSELIQNIVNRSIDYLGRVALGEHPAKDALLSHVTRYQSSFHDWIKGKSIYAPVTWFDAPPEVEKHRVGKLGEHPVRDEVLGRLLAERKLVSEMQLEIAAEHNALCKALVSSTSIPVFKKIRDEARTRFHNLSIFSLENYGFIKEIELSQSAQAARKLRKIDVSEFFSVVNKLRYNLRHILGEEHVYWPSAMDEIYESGPMKVAFSLFPMNKIGGRSFAARKSEYLTDVEDTEDVPAYDALEQWVRDGMVGKPPTELINDDNALVEEAAKHSHVMIITDDHKLCVEITKKSRTVVFRVPCRWYYNDLYFGVGTNPLERIQALRPGIQWTELSDTGSIKSFEENNFRDGALLMEPAIQAFNPDKKIDERDPVIIKEDDYSFSISDKEIVALVYDSANALRLRGSKKPPLQRNRAMTETSWRRTVLTHR